MAFRKHCLNLFERKMESSYDAISFWAQMSDSGANEASEHRAEQMPQAHSRHANASRKWREATESATDEDEPFSDHEDEPFSDYEDEEERQEPRRRLKRRRFPRQDTGPWESDLYKQFESGFFENADGPGPVLFREETRMPFAIFKEFLESARQT